MQIVRKDSARKVPKKTFWKLEERNISWLETSCFYLHRIKTNLSLLHLLIWRKSGAADPIRTCVPFHRVFMSNCTRSIFSSLHIDTDRPHLSKFSFNYVRQLCAVPEVSCRVYISDPNQASVTAADGKRFRIASIATSLLEISTETFSIAAFDINNLLLCHTWYQQSHPQSEAFPPSLWPAFFKTEIQGKNPTCL